MKFHIPKSWIMKKAALEKGCNVEAGSPMVLLTPMPVDLNDIVQPGHNLLINRRTEGTWGISLNGSNPRYRTKPIRATGLTLEDALMNLQQQPRI